jgi:hypothetical protein
MDTNQSNSGVGVTDVCKTCGLPKFTDMVQMQAEIERLKAERDAAIKEIGKWARDAGASQAREAQLRELLTQFELWESYDDPETPIRDALARIGSDDTALKEAIKQAKKDALFDAADMFVQQSRHEASYELRRMAEEIK